MSLLPDQPLTAEPMSGGMDSLRQALLLEQLRRQVYESVARRDLLTFTLGTLLEMLERYVPHAAGAVTYLVGDEAGGEKLNVVAGSRDPHLAARCSEFTCQPMLRPAESRPAPLRTFALPMPTALDARGWVVLTGLESAPVTAACQAVIDLAVELAGFVVARGVEAESVARRSMLDPLTGLPNLSLLEDRLTQTIELARRQESVAAIAVIHIDGLRQVNESLGRPAGDEVIRQAAARLQASYRRSDTVARIGGNTLAVVATVVRSREDADVLAGKTLSLLTAPYLINGHHLSLGATLGMSLFPNDGVSAPALLHAADVALHQARQRGRNVVAFFSADQQNGRLADLEMDGQLRRVIEFSLMRQALGNNGPEACPTSGRLELHYQPQVDAAGQMIGVEALARWTHPTLGRVPPAQFIAIAERNGLILALGRWVLNEAGRQAAQWRAAFGPQTPRVAVNVSSVQFASDSFIDDVATVLARTQLPPGLLELELTETVLMEDATESARRIAALRQMGIAVAIDDFGTGYSSLAYLHRLTIDTLKVDRSFVSALFNERRGPGDAGGTRQSGAAVIRAIVSLGRSLGMKVVAEGVETQAQLAMLVRIGCDEMQGYLFSPPAPAEQVTGMIQRGGNLTPRVPQAASA